MADTHNYFNKSVIVPYDQSMNRIFYQLRNRTPIMSMLNAKSTILKAKEYRWLDQRPFPPMYLGTDLSATGSITTAALTLLTEGSALQTGIPVYDVGNHDVFKIGSELIVVTAIPTTTAADSTTNGYTSITVTRGAFGSTAAVHAQYAEVKWAGNVTGVSDEFTGAVNDPGIPRIEYMQRFSVDTERDVMDAAITIDPNGGGVNEDAWRAPMKLALLNEAAVIRGKQQVPTTALKGAFNGLFNAGIEVPSGQYTATITQAEFQTVLDYLEDQGQETDTLLVGQKMKIALDAWYHGEISPTTQARMNMKDVETWFPTLTSTGRPLRIIRHKSLGTGEACFLDMKKIEAKYLYKTQKKTMGENGGGPDGQFDNMLLVATKRRGCYYIDDIAGNA